jgi:N-methylhydantoinase A/oxoprolinase/acetone carboxylase beta subunit
VRRDVRRLKRLGVESIVVCFLFSFVNPDHERRARELILEELPDVGHVSLSHDGAASDVAVLDEHGNYDITIGRAERTG